MSFELLYPNEVKLGGANPIGWMSLYFNWPLFYCVLFKILSVCYILSGFLDAFDGHAARAFNQSTKFGAMLDMLTDR